jgi:plastocyanin
MAAILRAGRAIKLRRDRFAGRCMVREPAERSQSPTGLPKSGVYITEEPMRRPIRFTLVAVAVAVTLGFAFATQAAKAKDDDATKNAVTIKDLKFNPAKLTIKPGETVVWTNKDDKDHTVVSDEKDAFKSDNLSSGDTFKHTFDKKGKFGYSCSYHPRMKGVITVAD